MRMVPNNPKTTVQYIEGSAFKEFTFLIPSQINDLIVTTIIPKQLQYDTKASLKSVMSCI